MLGFIGIHGEFYLPLICKGKMVAFMLLPSTVNAVICFSTMPITESIRFAAFRHGVFASEVTM